MNLAHVHLLLNHFPTIGFGIGLALYVASMIGKKDDLKRASLVILFLIAAVAIPTYMSGNAAEEVLKDKGVSSTAIRAHEDAALWAFIIMEITGFLAWLSLWQYRVIRRVPGWTTPIILILSLMSFAAMARTANLGGEIRHPEIASAPLEAAAPAADPEAEGTARALGSFVTGHTYVWP